MRSGGGDIDAEADVERADRGRVRQVVSWVGLLVWPAVALVVVAALFLGARQLAQSGAPLNVIDEHVHVDYVVHVSEGTVPYRGLTYDDRVTYEAACGVGLVTPPATTCTSAPTGGPLAGAYSSEYIHYPTYFLLTSWFSTVARGQGLDMTSMRLVSTVAFLVGLASLWLLGWVARLRGAQLAAVVTVPAAGAIFFLMGGSVNPSSTTLALGGLIAVGGLAWLRGPRGFWVFLAATLLAGVTAITSTMPAGAFFVYAAWVYGGRLLHRPRATSWTPTWWHLVLSALAVGLPWFVWGRWISATATVGNSALYGFAAVASRGELVRGAALEAVSIHTPWYAVPPAVPLADQPAWTAFASNIQQALPAAITLLVLGALLVSVIVRRRDTDLEPVSGERTDLLGVATGLLLVLWLYPVVLRLTNALSFGIDYPIVSRYSMSLTPLLVVLALKLVPQRPYSWLLAASGVLMLGAMAYALPLLPS